jgi:hypothetical protein
MYIYICNICYIYIYVITYIYILVNLSIDDPSLLVCKPAITGGKLGKLERPLQRGPERSTGLQKMDRCLQDVTDVVSACVPHNFPVSHLLHLFWSTWGLLLGHATVPWMV